MNLLQYRNKTVILKSKLIPWLEEILDEINIVELVQEQLADGKRGDNTSMPQYRPSTLKSKQKRGTVIMGNFIALIDTGEFWKSMFTTIKQGLISVDAKDWKRNELVQRYGESIFQISDTQFKYISTLVEPRLKAKIDQFYAQ